MRELSEEERNLNTQAKEVAARVLGEPVVAATRAQSISQAELTTSALNYGAGTKLMTRMTMKQGRMGTGPKLPRDFVLAVTATEIHALEDKHKKGQLREGDILYSWPREGLRVVEKANPLGSSGAAEDRQVLTAFLPYDFRGNPMTFPTTIVIGTDAASVEVSEAIVTQSGPSMVIQGGQVTFGQNVTFGGNVQFPAGMPQMPGMPQVPGMPQTPGMPPTPGEGS